MNSLPIVVVAITIFVIAYLGYGRWLVKTWGIDEKAITPAHKFEDGEDYIVRIMVDIANPAQYEFAPWMSMEAYVNGTRADLDKISDTRYRVSFSFTPSAEQYTVGDVNMDGNVTNKDSLILDRKLAKWKDYDKKIKIPTLADLNRNGSIENKDSLILNSYLAK